MITQLLDRVATLNKTSEPPWMITITGAPRIGFFVEVWRTGSVSVSARGCTIDEACQILIAASFPDLLGFL